jgi:hypothetical protein
MKLLREIRPGTAVVVYGTLREMLRGNEDILFDSMSLATATQNQPFAPPANDTERDQKLLEIQTKLQTAQLHSNRGTASLKFMREVARRTREQAGRLPGNVVDGVINAIHFDVPGKDATVELTSNLNWQISWTIKHRALDDVEKISLDVFDAEVKEIVPDYVVEYANTAILAYRQSMNATSAALLSIALEATLRDVLSNRGYSYVAGALPVDRFKYTEADVSVAGTTYSITFRDPNLKPPTEFHTSSGGQASVQISLRRYLNARNDGRVDLYVLAPPCLIDHWSPSDVEQPANLKSIGGLGQALRIARDVEKFLQPSKLPLELDDVLLSVRNNLIHLSEDTLDARLNLAGEDNRPMTLRQFLDDPWTMSSFVSTVVRFVNESYVELKIATP